MANLFGRFAGVNAVMARGFDKMVPYPPLHRGSLQPHEAKAMFFESAVVADVGGGKKPFALVSGLDTRNKTYVGLDVDADELARAPKGSYTETRVMDICAPDADYMGKFDLIICRNTLEHVINTQAAIAGVASLMAPGGRCLVRLPCRKALFARLNLLLPNETKRRIMHAVFPHKRGDGFPAYYDHCVPSAIRKLAEAQLLKVIAERRTYRSTYFGFFLPVYLVWRAISTVQYLTDPDYCENFEMVLLKPVSDKPQ